VKGVEADAALATVHDPAPGLRDRRSREASLEEREGKEDGGESCGHRVGYHGGHERVNLGGKIVDTAGGPVLPSKCPP
jgi:hypothetical protein